MLESLSLVVNPANSSFSSAGYVYYRICNGNEDNVYDEDFCCETSYLSAFDTQAKDAIEQVFTLDIKTEPKNC